MSGPDATPALESGRNAFRRPVNQAPISIKATMPQNWVVLYGTLRVRFHAAAHDADSTTAGLTDKAIV